PGAGEEMEAASPAGQMGEPSSRAAAILRIDLQGAAARARGPRGRHALIVRGPGLGIYTAWARAVCKQRGIARAKAVLFSTVESRTPSLGRGPSGAALEQLATETNSTECNPRARRGLVRRRRTANLAGDARAHD